MQPCSRSFEDQGGHGFDFSPSQLKWIKRLLVGYAEGKRGALSLIQANIEFDSNFVWSSGATRR